MARYKRKIFYSLEVDGKWWNKSMKQWVDDPLPGSSDTRRFGQATKAFKALQKCPSGSRLYRFIRKKTGWIDEYWKKI